MRVLNFRIVVAHTSLLVVTLLFSMPVYAAEIGVTVKIGLCGDGLIDTTEQCDGEVLGGASCATEGYSSGSLRCYPTCEFNTSDCVAAPALSVGGPGGNSNVSESRSEESSGVKNQSASDTTLTTLFTTLADILNNFVNGLISGNIFAAATSPETAASADTGSVSLSRGEGDSTEGALTSSAIVSPTKPTTAVSGGGGAAQVIQPNTIESVAAALADIVTKLTELVNEMWQALVLPPERIGNIFKTNRITQAAAAIFAGDGPDFGSETSAVKNESVGSRIMRFISAAMKSARRLLPF